MASGGSGVRAPLAKVLRKGLTKELGENDCSHPQFGGIKCEAFKHLVRTLLVGGGECRGLVGNTVCPSWVP